MLPKFSISNAVDALDSLRQRSGVHTGRPVATLIRAPPGLPSTSGRQPEAYTPALKRILTHADLHKCATDMLKHFCLNIMTLLMKLAKPSRSSLALVAGSELLDGFWSVLDSRL